MMLAFTFSIREISEVKDSEQVISYVTSLISSLMFALQHPVQSMTKNINNLSLNVFTLYQMNISRCSRSRCTSLLPGRKTGLKLTLHIGNFFDADD